MISAQEMEQEFQSKESTEIEEMLSKLPSTTRLQKLKVNCTREGDGSQREIEGRLGLRRVGVRLLIVHRFIEISRRMRECWFLKSIGN